VKANDGSWTQSLRSSQSYDSLGSNGAHRERPLHAKGSPDSNLEPLAEDEEVQARSPLHDPRGRRQRRMHISVEGRQDHIRVRQRWRWYGREGLVAQELEGGHLVSMAEGVETHRCQSLVVQW